MLGHKIRINKFNIIDNLQNIFSDHTKNKLKATTGEHFWDSQIYINLKIHYYIPNDSMNKSQKQLSLITNKNSLI